MIHVSFVAAFLSYLAILVHALKGFGYQMDPKQEVLVTHLLPSLGFIIYGIFGYLVPRNPKYHLQNEP